jgi:hypothetical protein
MPLQRGEVQGYNFNRMAVEFTMVNQGKVVPCSISTAAMDDLEGRRDVKSNQRIDQFMRLREIIEERASRLCPLYPRKSSRGGRPPIMLLRTTNMVSLPYSKKVRWMLDFR